MDTPVHRPSLTLLVAHLGSCRDKTPYPRRREKWREAGYVIWVGGYGTIVVTPLSFRLKFHRLQTTLTGGKGLWTTGIAVWMVYLMSDRFNVDITHIRRILFFSDRIPSRVITIVDFLLEG
jgi:hypothetical protein